MIKTPKSVEKDLEELEATFRNPNLLLETLNEMQQKRERTLKDIKLRVNEVNQQKSYLKAFYSFKSNESFVDESFGSLF